MRSDRELLLGLLALQNSFITKDQLIAAFSIWTSDKSKSLESILVQNKSVSDSQRMLLAALVEEHLKQHNNDPEKSLASIGSLPSIKSDLENIADSELLQTLMHVPSKAETPNRTPRETFVTVPTQAYHRETSRFRILRPHAAGGLGQVSVAMDEELKREVAFKEIKSEYADHEESRQRFVREAEITGALEHPSIVPVYGLGTYGDGRPYYAMRFIKGDSLKDWITQFHKKKTQMTRGEKTLALRQLLSRFIDVCQAMHYAHSRGVLHRDLKPHNVMLGKYGETLVVDWGLAKTLGEKTKERDPESTTLVTPNLSGSHEVTTQGSAIGTPAYMSPEQAEGKIDELGPASDVYSLGVTLYHCLTGRVPFAQKNTAEVLEAVRHGEYPKPRDVEPSTPRALESICLKAMRKQVRERYSSAKAISDDIEHFLADEPISGHKESTGEKLARITRKYKSATMTAMISLSVIALLLILGLLYVSSQWEKTRQLAEKNRVLAMNESRLAKESRELLDANMKQARVLRLESARIAFEYGLSNYNSPAQQEGVRELIRALWLSSADERQFDAQKRVILDQLTERGRSFCPPLRHENFVSMVQFSPHGKYVATASFDTSARVWDAFSGKPIGKPLTHKEVVVCIHFLSNDERVVTGSRDGVATIWDVTTGTQVGETMRGASEIRAIDICPDGSRIAIAYIDGTARVWSSATGKPIGNELIHSQALTSVAFAGMSQDRIATACADGSARIWDVSSGKQIGESMTHSGIVWCVASSSNGKYFATASEDGAARIWDAQTGIAHGPALKHSGRITHIRFSSDSQLIATASADRTARIWNVETGEAVGKELKHADGILDVEFSPNGRWAATASYDKTAQVWDIESGVPIGETIRHADGVNCIRFSPDGFRIVTGSEDGTARIWDVLPRLSIAEPSRHSKGVASVAFSPTGRQVVTGAQDGMAQVWDAQTGAAIGEPIRHGSVLSSVAFNHDGQMLIAAGNDGVAQVWNASTRLPVGQPMRHTDWISMAKFSRNGEQIATASADFTARIWNASTGAPIGKPLKHSQLVYSVDFSPDGRQLATSSLDIAQIWDLEKGTPIGGGMRHSNWVRWITFSPDGQYVATVCENAARLWSVSSGLPVGDPMRHEAEVTSVAFRPDGRLLVTTCEDGTAWLWDVETKKKLGSPLSHLAWISSAAFSPSGDQIATASRDTTMRIWDISKIPEPANQLQWIELLANLRCKDDGSVVVLSGDEVQDRWDTIERDSTWRTALQEFSDRTANRFHQVSVREAEFLRHWAAVEFSLGQLLQKQPQNEDLNRRLSTAKKFMPIWRKDFSARQAELSGNWVAAIPLLESILTSISDDHNLMIRLGLAHYRIGEQCRFDRKFSEAVASYERACNEIQKAISRAPNEDRPKLILGECRQRMGESLLTAGNSNGAIDCFVKALEVQRSREAILPGNNSIKFKINACYELLIDAAMQSRNYDHAQKQAEAALKYLDAIQAGGLASPLLVRSRMIYERKLAVAAGAKRAIENLDSIFEQDPAMVAELVAIRIRDLKSNKNHDEANTTAKRFVDWAANLQADRDNQRYNAACILAISAEGDDANRDRLVDEALTILQELKASQYFDTDNAAHIKVDSDFDAIRTHPKFEAFIASLDKLP